MTISLSCSSCGRDYALKDAAAGKQFRCKDCNAMLTVPEAGVEDYGGDDDVFGGGDTWGSSDDGYALPPRRSYSEPAPAKSPKKKVKRSSGGGGIDPAVLATIGKVLVGLVVAVGVGVAAMRLSKGNSNDWREFSPAGQPISIQLPGAPKHGTQMGLGFSLTTQSVEFRRPERIFGLMYGDLPIPAGTPVNIQAGLEGAKQNMVMSMPGTKIVSSRTMNIADAGGNLHPMIEVVATIPKSGDLARVYYRFAFVGSKMVVVLTGARDEDADDYEADFYKCLDSLKITQTIAPLGNSGAGMNPAFHPGGFDNGPIGEPIPGPSFGGQEGGFSSNPAEDAMRRMQEQTERQMAESRARMEQMRRESEERMREMRSRNGFQTPANFP